MNVNIIDIKSQARPIYGVYFICCMGNYLKIIEDQLNLLLYSGLYEKTKKIFCYICLYNPNDKELHNLFYHFYPKVEFFSTSENLYEKFAINNYRQNLPNEPFYLYYFHTKGVSKPDNSHWVQRRKILNFYTIVKHDISIKLLQYYDAVGVTLFRYPKIHFSGNFWWSKSEHIFTLPYKINNKYLSPEMYICSSSKPNCKYIGLSKEEDAFGGANINNHINLKDEEIINNLCDKVIINTWGIEAMNLC